MRLALLLLAVGCAGSTTGPVKQVQETPPISDVTADLARPADLSVAPDLTVPADLSTPPDLTDLGYTCTTTTCGTNLSYQTCCESAANGDTSCRFIYGATTCDCTTTCSACIVAVNSYCN